MTTDAWGRRGERADGWSRAGWGLEIKQMTRSMATRHPLPASAAPQRATLYDIFLAEGGRRAGRGLPVALLSDANVALLTHALRLKASAKLGALCPPDLSLEGSDAFANALMNVALELQWQGVSASTLAGANAEVLARALLRLSTESSTFARHKEFMELGVNPAMAPRPEFDAERAERKELQRPTFGHAAHSPWDAYAESRGLFDEFRPFNGLAPHEATGSDEWRVKVFPWAPAARHGAVPWA